MAILNYGHVFAAGGFSGESYDICSAVLNTGVISALLPAGYSALTSDAPHALVSTGTLGASAILDISGMEVDADDITETLNGRFFYLSVQNSDISAINSISVSGSTSVNGSSVFLISNTGDYLFHHIAGGVWRCNILATPGNGLATFKRLSFTGAEWALGTPNQILVSQASGPAAGQIGPHGITPYDGYIISVLNTDLNEYVDVEIEQDTSTGDFTLVKAPLAPAFAGIVLIAGSLD